MKNITVLELRLRKYPDDKKRLEEERQRYDDAREMTPERYLREVACQRTKEHDPTGTLAVTYRHRFKYYRKNVLQPYIRHYEKYIRPEYEIMQRLEASLLMLEAEDRELLTEYYIRNRPKDELATERGISRSTLWRRCEDALEKLQTVYDQAFGKDAEGLSNTQNAEKDGAK